MAGVLQWRVRVSEGAENPNNIGSYSNTIEIGNGGTTGYDEGIDFDLDTSVVPNTYFFVSYVDHDPGKIEYEFTQELLPDESYTVRLSFENPTGGFFLASTSVEFLASDDDFVYELTVDSNDNGSSDVFRSGSVHDLIDSGGEMQPWNQLLFPGSDHHNDWYFGVLTLMLAAPVTNANADFNGDEAVDGADLVLWEAGFGTGQNAASTQGDSDADEDVDGHDFLNWQRQFGQNAAGLDSISTSAATRVPEPAPVTLLVAGSVSAAMTGIGARKTQECPCANIA